METLVFEGRTAGGADRFAAELRVPGSNELQFEIPGWPVRLFPGTLNIKINAGGFPPKFLTRFGSPSIKRLDSRLFKPIVELPAHLIANNTLPPAKERPDRGNAQIWRATLFVVGSQAKTDCWVLRRIGSGYDNVLECVSAQPLREVLGAPKPLEVPIQLHLFGNWVT